MTDTKTWNAITFAATAIDQERVTTYLVPARDGARVPTVFIDAQAFAEPEQSLHYKFLTESFPAFAALTYEEYVDSITDPKRREWFGGSLTELVAPGKAPLFGFTVSDKGSDPGATPSCDQLRAVHKTLQQRFTVGALAVVPANELQRRVLARCGLPVLDPSSALEYEPYTQGKRCGTLRRYTLAALAAAEARGEIGWRDVIVTSEAPLDIETIVAGVVTGTRQGELSHLNVRSAARGTPNCYVKGAYERLAKREGQLVELECGPTAAAVAPITASQAEACNQTMKPDPVTIVAADLTFTPLVSLLDVPTETAAQRRAAAARFGSKGANLAVLYRRIDARLRLPGFLIPFHHYDDFMRASPRPIDLGAGPERLSLQGAVDRLLRDPAFLREPALRRRRLAALQAAMREGTCDAKLLGALRKQMRATFGSDDVMVRFRSSSNAEDALHFNGAGLYDSTSVCLADDTDADAAGPSRCDADEPNERGVCRGLARVWASLWNMKAFEERAWYGIDHRHVAMAVLVDTRTKGELANMVAFTGNPLLRGDPRYLVNAQRGELEVVSTRPGVWPEKDLLTLRAGSVVRIERARPASGLAAGTWVLDDARLTELGAALAKIAAVYPIDEPAPATARVLLDTEWKLRSDGRLAIKQVRPFID